MENTKKVPLVDRTGETPRVIGEAEVRSSENCEWVEVVANVTDEVILKALKPKTGQFSIAPEMTQ